MIFVNLDGFIWSFSQDYILRLQGAKLRVDMWDSSLSDLEFILILPIQIHHLFA